jgi:hypothetical protein
VTGEVQGDGGTGDGATGATSFTVDALKEAGIPDTFLGNGTPDFKAISAAITEAQTLKAASEERAKGIPQDGKYDFATLPKDFKAPEGIDPKSWKVNEAWAAEVAPVLKEIGVTQGDVTKLVAAVARADAAKKIAQGKTEQEREAAELKALGEGGPKRLENLDKAIRAAGYGALLDDKSTLAQRLEAFEKIVNSRARSWPLKAAATTGKSAPNSKSSPVRNCIVLPSKNLSRPAVTKED